MSMYKDDACTDLILDFIARYESSGNYNAVSGDSQADDDLSGYTLNGIYILQNSLLQRRRPSTAVGRYQIVRNTLRSLEDRLDLDGVTRFTPALQDRLALELLIGRGFMKWRAGTITDEEFAHNLSCEWAALPDPRNEGRSHYDGDGANRALVSMDKVYELLRRARMLIRREPDEPVPVAPITPPKRATYPDVPAPAAPQQQNPIARFFSWVFGWFTGKASA